MRLAPAYDLLCTLIYENSMEEMALGIDGIHQIRRITRENFQNEAKKIGLAPTMAVRRFDQMQAEFEDALTQSAAELCSCRLLYADDVVKEILHIYRERFS